MMNRLVTTACLVTLCAATTSAFAQPGENNRGFYVGAGLGNFSTEYSNVDSVDDLDDVDWSFDEDEDASKIFGGWRFNRYLAFEVDRYDFDKSSTAQDLLNVTAETKGWSPNIIGTLPLGPVELSAKAGYIFYDVDVISNDELVLDSSGRDPVYSAAIGFTILDHLNLKLEYEVIDISDFDDAEAVWISGSWRF